MPAFFKGLETPGEVLYRRFRNLADVRRIETVLSYIPRWFAALRPWLDETDRAAARGLSLTIGVEHGVYPLGGGPSAYGSAAATGGGGGVSAGVCRCV